MASPALLGDSSTAAAWLPRAPPTIMAYAASAIDPNDVAARTAELEEMGEIANAIYFIVIEIFF